MLQLPTIIIGYTIYLERMWDNKSEKLSSIGLRTIDSLYGVYTDHSASVTSFKRLMRRKASKVHFVTVTNIKQLTGSLSYV